MLEITIPDRELYDEENEVFINIKKTVLHLEHSLVSISKWEMTWKKPFLKPNYNFSSEEFRDYIRCMTIDQNVPKEVYVAMSNKECEIIKNYINDEKTATTFSNVGGGSNRDIITSELIYYWMTVYQIPFECQKWHLSRLLTLIKICSVKNSKNKKMPINSILTQNKKLNDARRKAMNTKG